jgi:hypothetical protein
MLQPPKSRRSPRLALLKKWPSRGTSASKLNARDDAPPVAVSLRQLRIVPPFCCHSGRESIFLSLGLCTRALLDQEEKAAMNQRMLEMDNQLAALTASGQALCDVVLGTSRGSPQLACHLDKACFQVDSLVSEGVHYGAHAALTSVDSHYGGVNFDAIGRGYALGKSKNDVLTIGDATARSTEVLASRMLATSICL